MKIGITGHQRIEDPNNWAWVEQEIDKIFNQSSRPLIGITCLAIGADQVFAKAVLRHNGAITAIIPFTGYELMFSAENDREQYFRLLSQAENVNVLPRLASDEASYFEAGKKIVGIADVLVAVWNGKPARGLGGTGDVVEYAKQHGKKIYHLNPVDCQVIEL